MIEEFFKKFRKDSSPILLGLSGGPDSLCLFYQLVRLGIPFSAAHIDHGWRQESAEEAQILSRICADNGIDFFLKTLRPEEMKGNLEDACRGERLRFFYEIYQRGYQALVLGHQAGDLAETVLKRLFEGAGLTSLASMGEVSRFKDMPVWRPLLGISKEEILLWLKENGITAFEDSTNLDTKFLRPRFRQAILPYLSECFGKNITPSLLAISSEAKELDAYMEEKCAGYSVHRGVFGAYIDLQGCHPFETKYLIRKMAREFSLVVSRDELNTCVSFILEKKGNKQINGKFYIDRGRLFILDEWEAAPFETRALNPGEFEMGDWHVKFEASSAPAPATDWKGVWEGQVAVSLPAGAYFLGPGAAGWMGQVPAILRSRVPSVWKGPEVFHEFLSGRKCPKGEFLLTLIHRKKTVVA